MSYACIYVADFPAQAILRAEPPLRPFALAVLDGAPPQEFVAALNEFARTSGVQMDMPRTLLEQCPSLMLRRRSPELEAEAHAALLRVTRSFSPRVEETAADTLLCDLAGMDALFGALEQIAASLAQSISQIALHARVAVANTPDTALAAARGIAGVTVIPPGREAEMLGKLPLAVLAPPLELMETLERWGIRDFRALAALPTAQLSERLGQPGVHLQELARGTFARALHCHETPVEFTEALELDDSVEELEPLAFILNRLLISLCEQLNAYALATNEIRVHFELDLTAGLSRQVHDETASDGRRKAAPTNSFYEKLLRLPVPTCDAALLLNLLRLSLAANPPQAPIEKVRVTALPARQRTAQGGLFIPLGPDPQKMEVTLARIAGVVGAGNVGAAHLLDTHRPGAFRMQRFEVGVADVGAALRRPAVHTGAEAHRRCKAAPTEFVALRIFRPSVAATVQLQRDVPARVSFGGVRGTVTTASGPWRTSGDWWQPDAWQQDTWDVELAVAGSSTPGFYQIYFDRAANAWFVRGEFD